MASTELAALFAILPNVTPQASTACTAWTAHALLAHLAAGAKERADLIEEKLAGRPERATKAFAEREAVFRAMHDEEVRAALMREAGRFEAAVTALAQQGAHVTIAFATTRFTALSWRRTSAVRPRFTGGISSGPTRRAARCSRNAS
jgi:hypothetical protein